MYNGIKSKPGWAIVDKKDENIEKSKPLSVVLPVSQPIPTKDIKIDFKNDILEITNKLEESDNNMTKFMIDISQSIDDGNKRLEELRLMLIASEERTGNLLQEVKTMLSELSDKSNNVNTTAQLDDIKSLIEDLSLNSNSV